MPKRVNLYLRDEPLARLDEKARQIGRGRGAAVEEFIEQSDGNFRHLRHKLRNALGAAVLHCAEARASILRADILTAVAAIERSLQEADTLLAKPN